MAVDFTKPIATADRAQNLTDTKDTMAALAKMLDGLTPTGVANGMIRWNTSANRFEKYNGSWGALSSAYAINVTTFNGQAASYYTDIPNRLGYTPLNKAGGTMTGALTLNAAPTVDLHASTKKYVDDGLATKAGTSHTHSWDVITNKGLNEGTDTQDPNATQFHQIVTNHANSPDSGYFWHITTTFYGALTGSRAQIAVQYSDMARVYARSYFSGTWQPWVRCDLGETSTQSILSPGYQKLPGGLIVQWGTTGLTSDATPAAITFPIAFPTVCRSVQLTTLAASSGNWGNCIASGVTTSGFTARRYSGSSNVADAYWTALGF